MNSRPPSTLPARRPLIVAEAPGVREGRRRPLEGRCEARLTDLMGHDVHALYRAVNLLHHWPGPSSKGSAFPIEQARARASRLRLVDGSILLGRRVARAFCLEREPFLEWLQLRPGVRVAVVPHPSGISHWWNDRGNVERARAFLTESLRD